MAFRSISLTAIQMAARLGRCRWVADGGWVAVQSVLRWWRIDGEFLTGWNHVARDVWPQGRAIIFFITSSSSSKENSIKERSSYRVTHLCRTCRSPKISHFEWSSWSTRSTWFYSTAVRAVWFCVEKAWLTFTANQLRSLMKKQIREGEGSQRFAWFLWNETI